MSEGSRRVGSRPLYVVFNPRSGSAAALGLTAAALAGKFRAAGLEAEIDADSSRPLEVRVAKALASDAEIIVAAGGDGTITALAHALVDTPKTLALLPLGTANLLARDLKIPLDLDRALAELATMTPCRIDVGDVNGRIFLHKVVIGTIPGIAAARETIRGKASLRARLDFVRYFLQRLSEPRRIALHIHPVDGASRVERVRAVAVANNAYDEGLGRFFARERLDRGTLTLYVLKRLGLSDTLRLTLAMLMGRWRQDSALAIEEVEGVVLHMKKHDVRVMIDGEVVRMDPPLTFRIRPQALSILAPAAVALQAGTPNAAGAG